MGDRLYRCGDLAFLRAAAYTELPLPACPDLSGDTPEHVAQWLAWLRGVWAIDTVADAIDHASPVLAQEVRTIAAAEVSGARRARRAVSSAARYVLRMTGRATPFGLFAGVAPASFGQRLTWRWGTAHRAVARVSGAWLAEVVAQLESCGELFERLQVVTNDLCFRRSDRLVVPYPPRAHGRGRAAAGISVRYTAAVRLAVETARSPVRCDELAGKLAAEFPSTPLPLISGMLADLVKQRVLISNLQPPTTVADALGYVIGRLEAAGANGIPQAADVLFRLYEIQGELARHNGTAEAAVRRRARTTAVTRMREISAEPAPSIALNLHLDSTLALPRHVAREAEAAASVLARLTAHPLGTESWQAYHTSFFKRYGIGALVPVLELVNLDVGLGFPAGYLEAAPQPRLPISARDEWLLALAQAAALDGRDEVVLNEGALEQLAPDEPVRWPAHAEMCFQIQAVSETAVNDGDFTLAVTGVSRGAATMVGRFLGSLSQVRRDQVAAAFGSPSTIDPDALPVQLSFAPLSQEAVDVSRAPELLPHVIGLSEYPAGSSARISVDDLAVGCDGEGLYLASISMRRRVEPVLPHALDLRAHTPPIARFLAEVGKAQAAVLTGFDWGAARHLPFLPRIRYRRTILSPTRWILDAAGFPAEKAPWSQWEETFWHWAASRRLPRTVLMAEGDRRLKLNLADRGQLALLRASLRQVRKVVLEEATDTGAYGWCGGRTHEIVVQLASTRTPQARQPIGVQVVGRGDGHVPGTSPWLFVKLYGHPDRQTELLTRHVPALLARWGEQPGWWFIRYRDPDPHVRLRIALSDPTEFGEAAARVGSWARQLRCLGLLRDLQFATYHPETGRWGDGPLLAAAEGVFGADSRALMAQLTEPSEGRLQVLTAAHFVAIAIAFNGSTELGMSWLIEHAAAKTLKPISRDVLDEAVRMADPTDDWARLRALPGGSAIVDAWRPRDRALAAYRALLEGKEGVAPDAVLTSLLHAHHMRALGIDPGHELTCLRLTRAAAQAWVARRAGR